MVYFIREIRYPLSPVKIGYVRRGIRAAARRLHHLQTGNPRRLAIVAMMPGDNDTEHALHLKFKSLRVVNEWFRWEQPLIDTIAPYMLAVPIAYQEADDQSIGNGWIAATKVRRAAHRLTLDDLHSH